jgi:hypothetical protein
MNPPLARQTRNSRAQKRQALYDGHNRRAGDSDKEMRWRRLRRRMQRWMRELLEP